MPDRELADTCGRCADRVTIMRTPQRPLRAETHSIGSIQQNCLTPFMLGPRAIPWAITARSGPDEQQTELSPDPRHADRRPNWFGNHEQ